mmetsp:Transcript_31553/g.67862  ORF Transcript_31553/g.67862 Transcript_31553/m.67862 type:complete len:217 (-) Transcript_31553:379-1029(-)
MALEPRQASIVSSRPAATVDQYMARLRPLWCWFLDWARADSAVVYTPRIRTLAANSRRFCSAASLTCSSFEALKSTTKPYCQLPGDPMSSSAAPPRGRVLILVMLRFRKAKHESDLKSAPSWLCNMNETEQRKPSRLLMVAGAVESTIYRVSLSRLASLLPTISRPALSPARRLEMAAFEGASTSLHAPTLSNVQWRSIGLQPFSFSNLQSQASIC